MDITFINVGYGESILITCEEPGREDGLFVMLIDGGSDMDSEYTGESGRIRGDTNAAGFQHILRESPELLRAEVYKIGHHGQPDSVTEELVRAVDLDFIVCCASNDYRHTSSNEKTFETIRQAMAGKPITYLFQDGLYNEKWNPNTAPRSGVTLRIDEAGITWHLC